MSITLFCHGEVKMGINGSGSKRMILETKFPQSGGMPNLCVQIVSFSGSLLQDQGELAALDAPYTAKQKMS